MAVIGSFGGLVFEVSENKIQSYSEFKRTTNTRWEKHNIRGQKPLLEFDGPDVDPISFNISFKAELGVNPEAEMAKLREFARRGKKAPFIRGNKPISVNYWVIEKIVETHKRIDNHGNVLTIEAQVDLLEYDNSMPKEKSKKTVSNTKKNKSTNKKGKGIMTITVKSVHIRSGPSINNKVIGYAMKGDKLTVYGEKNGWYSIGGGKYITANVAYSSFK